jgi:hypothetical protein
MVICSLIYYLICFIALAGIVLLLKDRRGRDLIRAKRWRLKVKRIKYKELPIIKSVFLLLEKRKQERVEVEILEAISFMRNLIAIGEGKTLNSDSLVEQLILHNGLLSPIYSGMLRYLRHNQWSEGIDYFADYAGTKTSKNFARLLIQWDEIAPKQLLETLVSMQNSIGETRLTSLRRKDEIVSDIIYLPVVINIILIFMNFVYVGYFLEQKEMLTMLL